MIFLSLSANIEKSYVLRYYDFNITEASVLEDPRALCLAKVQAMYERVKEQFDITYDPNVEAFIQGKKLEIKFYDSSNKEYEKEL